MGVDYSARFGLGFKVNFKEDIVNEEYGEVEDEFEYLQWLAEGTDFRTFEIGEGSYTGEQNDMYVVLKDPFDKRDGLYTKELELKTFLDKNGICYEGEFDVVGGLHIW